MVEKEKYFDDNGREDPKTRKWLLTINNPDKLGYNNEYIIDVLKKWTSITYYCLSDEIGLECGTPHKHLFLYAPNGIRFSTLLKRFKGAHFDIANGTCLHNRNYVFKEDKWLNDKKADTNDRNSHIEFGELPIERQGKRNDMDDLYDMIISGMSDAEIIAECPEFMTHFDKIDKVRQSNLFDKFKDKWRDLEVVYIYGETGSGKTRDIMENYGYSNVYRVCNYKNPFDNYKGQDVIVFEEFRSSLYCGDMLKYLDGYPVELPCRYNDKCACFTKVFICTNIPLKSQYKELQKTEKETFNAFLRRINKIKKYTSKGVFEYSTTDYKHIEEIETCEENETPFKSTLKLWTNDDIIKNNVI